MSWWFGTKLVPNTYLIHGVVVVPSEVGGGMRWQRRWDLMVVVIYGGVMCCYVVIHGGRGVAGGIW